MRERLRLLAQRHGAFVAVCAVLLGGFEYLIVLVVKSLKLSDTLTNLAAILPPPLRLVLENTFTGDFSARGLLAFGWSHPIPQAIGAAVAVVLATRAIAGACEDGTIEIALALPISRARHLAADVVFALVALAAIGLVGAGAAIAAQRLHGVGGVEPRAMLRLAANWWSLQAAWFGVALALSSVAREGARASGAVFVIAVASFVAEVIGRLWEGAKWVLPWTLYDYFSPRDVLLKNAAVLGPSLILCSVLAAGLTTAFMRFQRRDLP
jgi:ABC-type transport system involved in multi-copper enzyme maturation permease subunit